MKWLVALAIAPCLLATPLARADGPGAAAQAAFEEGRKLEDARDFSGAIARFEESERLDPALGTTLNLAACYEQAGRLASAWRAFRRGADEASALGEEKRARRAAALADALAPRLSSLTLTVQGAPPDDEEIRIDGALVARSAWATSQPIDGGKHRIAARANGRREWSTEVEVTSEGGRTAVTVPLLEVQPATPESRPAESPPASPAEPPSAEHPLASPDQPYFTPLRIAGAATAGVGVIALGIGVGFAIQARNLWVDREAQCLNNLCSDTGYTLSSQAHDAALRANVALAIGGVAVAAGGIVFLLAPRAKGNDVHLAVTPEPGGGALHLTGIF